VTPQALGILLRIDDIWMLSKQFSFDGASLSAAITATFERRDTVIPERAPTALTEEFAGHHGKQTQWTAFLQRHGLADAPPEPSSVVRDLRTFLLEPLRTAAQRGSFRELWKPGGPWI
jgi:hypothetical protein